VSDPLAPKRALITGASSGIGEAFARHLAANGWDLVIVARRKDRLERLSAEISQLGRKCEVVVADLSTEAGISTVIAAANGIEFLVANAGITHVAGIGITEPFVAHRIVNLLATGVMDLCEAIVPEMIRRRRGDVIVVSSIAAFTPMRKSAIYAASKSFVTTYVRSIALEAKSAGVRVTAVCPGYVRTELHEQAGLGHLRSQVPKMLWLDPDDVVAAAMRGLDRNKVVVIPGLIYRLVRPFLGLTALQRVWGGMTRRNNHERQNDANMD
jgi:hypothetical protein